MGWETDMGKHLARGRLRSYVLYFGDGVTKLKMTRETDSDIVRDVRCYNAEFMDTGEPTPYKYKIVKVTLDNGTEVWTEFD